MPDSPPYDDFTDLELVDLYRSTQDPLVTEELIERYRIHIYGRCLRLTESHTDAKDLQQETIEGLLTWLQSEKPCEHFSALVYRVATHKSIDFMRRKSRYHTILAEIERKTEKSVADFVQNPDLIRLTLEEAEREIEVRAKLRNLTDLQRRCIKAFYFEQLSYRQIATTISKPISEVRNALQTGKRRLRQMLTKD